MAGKREQVGQHSTHSSCNEPRTAKLTPPLFPHAEGSRVPENISPVPSQRTKPQKISAPFNKHQLHKSRLSHTPLINRCHCPPRSNILSFTVLQPSLLPPQIQSSQNILSRASNNFPLAPPSPDGRLGKAYQQNELQRGKLNSKTGGSCSNQKQIRSDIQEIWKNTGKLEALTSKRDTYAGQTTSAERIVEVKK
jgi:hypothetical protein